MKRIVSFFIFIASFNLWATLSVPNLPAEGTVGPDNNHFIDPRVDYERFMGRVSDKSDDGKILKIKVENNNSKLFKVGDPVTFRVNNHDARYPCKGVVRSTEDFYFAIRVTDLKSCWSKNYFPRGMQLNFFAPKLAQRVVEASEFRKGLILRKEDFLKQLNDINHFMWTYEQQKVKVAADYDQRINEMTSAKREALDNLLEIKKENLILQTELRRKLDELDESLKFYSIERQEHLTDRWNLDHDSGLPVGQRPQPIKKR